MVAVGAVSPRILCLDGAKVPSVPRAYGSACARACDCVSAISKALSNILLHNGPKRGVQRLAPAVPPPTPPASQQRSTPQTRSGYSLDRPHRCETDKHTKQSFRLLEERTGVFGVLLGKLGRNYFSKKATGASGRTAVAQFWRPPWDCVRALSLELLLEHSGGPSR